MVGKRPNMMMKDELYVDRRIKIFKVKKKGPIFDVKKIAADLKARTTKPVVERTVQPEEQTKSDLINSNRIKAFTVHVKKPPVREPRQPIESNPKEIFTITDSSDEVSSIIVMTHLDTRDLPLDFMNSRIPTTMISQLHTISTWRLC